MWQELEVPCKPQQSLYSLSVGAGFLVMARTLAGLTHSPLSVATCPMKGTSFCRRLSLSVLSLTPCSLQWSKNIIRTLSWSQLASSPVLPQPTMMKSSATTSIPDSPSTSSCIFCWKTSGAELTPKGKHLQGKCPKGVWKVVRYDDVSSRATCQNLLCTSSLVKTLAPCSHIAISSIVGRG